MAVLEPRAAACVVNEKSPAWWFAVVELCVYTIVNVLIVFAVPGFVMPPIVIV